MNKNIIEYQCKSSISDVEDITILVLSNTMTLYQNILESLNINTKNIKYIDASNFDFFTNNPFADNSFDLIIGNPSNIRQEKIKKIKPLLNNYKSFYPTADLNIYFFEKGFNLLKENGILSYITENKYTKAKYAKKFRKFILENTSIREYISFNSLKLNTSIIIYQKSKIKDNKFLYCDVDNKYKENNELRAYINDKAFYYPQSDLRIHGFNFLTQIVLQIKQRIEAVSTPLKEITINIKSEKSKYFMALLNSKLFLFYYKVNDMQFSTGYEFKKFKVENTPIPKIKKEAQKPFEILVDYIIFAKEQDLSLEASLFESVIDGMVYDLYFEEEMKRGDCFISDEVRMLLGEFKSDKIDEVYKVFKNSKTIGRGLIYSRVISVVKTINGVGK